MQELCGKIADFQQQIVIMTFDITITPSKHHFTAEPGETLLERYFDVRK